MFLMIKIEYVEIVGNGKTINYYLNKGYDIKCHQKISIKMDDLIPTSSIRIDCYCDICGCLNNIKYYNYIGNVKRNGIYRCNECAKAVRSDSIKSIFENNVLKDYIVNKSKNTMMRRYGSDNPSKIDIFRKKIIETNNLKYGANNPMKNADVKNRLKDTVNEKYGVDWVINSSHIKEKIKNTMIERYGVDNPFKSEDIKNKIKKTLIDRYGVDNPTKNPTIFQRAQRSSYKVHRCVNNDILYQGSYELDFIIFCENNDINFENGPIIDYILDGVHRKYHSDFLIKDYNLICEVKSSWTYNRDLYENLKKREFSISSGYNFIFIIDKNYDELYSIIK